MAWISDSCFFLGNKNMREKENEEERKRCESENKGKRSNIREKEREKGLERSQGKENKSKGVMEGKRGRTREDGRRGWETRKEEGNKKSAPTQ